MTTKERTLLGLAAVFGLILASGCSSSDDSAGGTAGNTSSGGSVSTGGSTAKGGSTSTGGGGGSNVAGSTSSGGGGAAAIGGGGAGGASAGTGGAAAGSGGASGSTAGGASGSGGAGGAAADTFTLQMANGSVVATAAGLTLYVYQPDTPAAGATAAKSMCSGTCLTHWPLYYGNPVVVPAGLDASDFGSFDRGGGVMQSTYKGWPVYTYDDDKKAGDAKGDLEKAAGKVVWYAIRIPFTAPPKP